MKTKILGASSEANPWISPNYRASDWRSLDLRNPDGQDWQKAVDILYDRLNGRFLAHVKLIEHNPNKEIKEFCGFVILAIDCLIIETMYQFYNGVNETNIKHEEAFWKFFSNSIFFNKDFDSKNKAILFYRHFRCGILHQAQTKRASKIRIGLQKMIEQSVAGNINNGLIIDRKKFHQALINEIDNYKDRLRNPKIEEDYVLRENFIKKMSYIVN